MNKLKGSLTAKIFAVILLAVSCLVLCGAMAGVLWLDSESAYKAASAQELLDHVIDSRLENAAYPLLNEACHRPVRELYPSNEEAICFELLDEKQEALAGCPGADATALRSRIVSVKDFYGGLYFTDESAPLKAPKQYAEAGGLSPEPTPRPTLQGSEELADAGDPEGTLVCFVRMSWTGKNALSSLGYDAQILSKLFPYRYALIGAAAVSFILAVLFFVFLMAAAGHHDASGEVKAGFVEKLPADLLWLLGLGGMGLCAGGITEFFGGSYLVGSLLLTAVLLVVAGLLLLLCLMSTAVRLKLGVFLESCLIWRFLCWIWRAIKAGFGLLRGVPLVWKWIPPFLILFFFDFACTMHWRCRDGGMIAIGLILKALLLAAAILYLTLAFKRLRDGAKAIAAGDENVVIDEKHLIGDLRDHAEDLNHIRDGLSRAVDERMKSERLRTELITNVSHDIKTPLTSIVNYVDLLSREELQNEKAAEYLEVLQRQSARLKKLTDDLVEASKASTGNLPVAKEALDLGVLLDQAAGEYGERLAEKQLDLRVAKPAEPVTVQADPRHLWRMIDNLMGNVLKYAQPGTRVYLTLAQENGRAALSFRNISAAPLNVKPEELTERFVRGDAARSTEGSGLGLAITASLAKLQGIDMALSVDGDLFKVVLSF